MNLFISLLFIGLVSADITSYDFTSINFNSTIKWKGDGEYNISVKNYGESDWKTIFTDVKEGTHVVSDHINIDYLSFWIKFEQGSNKTIKYGKSICQLAEIGHPSIKLDTLNDGVHLYIEHPYAIINGQKRPIYRDEELCGIVLQYTVNFTFGESPPVSYNINDMNCNNSGCYMYFFTTERVCVIATGNYDYLLNSISTPWTPKKSCVNPKNDVYTCLVNTNKYLQNEFKDKTDRLIDRKYNKGEADHLKSFVYTGIKNFNNILNLYEEEDDE
ncbi:soluble interferon-gamma receptor-like protein [Yokapox virus]|uniref:Soluble interferon-gamma receptor-like protein n=1 Tax=Yokapox virus TaxID=1076255 RepID=G3EI55_9POXV|nr:soluble interferon-gamma receptor-like protein [Yokapox virus]AEN03752.1 soluble interferon-gamma receptor-like protein [Yokapox virus]